MQIFAIGRNYAEHAKELNNPVPERPVTFILPNSSRLHRGSPLFYPDFTKDIHHEIEVVIKICKKGKKIEPRFAHKYFDQFTLGIDFTARDLQQELKDKGHPWEIAKGFDGATVIGSMQSIDLIKDIHDLDFKLLKNGELVQTGNTRDMLFSFEDLIVHLSQYFTLHVGDMIFTGTPSGVGPVVIGDSLEGYVGDKKLVSCKVK